MVEDSRADVDDTTLTVGMVDDSIVDEDSIRLDGIVDDWITELLTVTLEDTKVEDTIRLDVSETKELTLEESTTDELGITSEDV